MNTSHASQVELFFCNLFTSSLQEIYKDGQD